jgi:hypothetical protein
MDGHSITFFPEQAAPCRFDEEDIRPDLRSAADRDKSFTGSICPPIGVDNA